MLTIIITLGGVGAPVAEVSSNPVVPKSDCGQRPDLVSLYPQSLAVPHPSELSHHLHMWPKGRPWISTVWSLDRPTPRSCGRSVEAASQLTTRYGSLGAGNSGRATGEGGGPGQGSASQALPRKEAWGALWDAVPAAPALQGFSLPHLLLCRPLPSLLRLTAHCCGCTGCPRLTRASTCAEW